MINGKLIIKNKHSNNKNNYKKSNIRNNFNIISFINKLLNNLYKIIKILVIIIVKKQNDLFIYK